jgi:hypothetical protein
MKCDSRVRFWPTLTSPYFGHEPKVRVATIYEGTCFGHVIFKTCQYATNDDKVFVGLENVNVKEA